MHIRCTQCSSLSLGWQVGEVDDGVQGQVEAALVGKGDVVPGVVFCFGHTISTAFVGTAVTPRLPLAAAAGGRVGHRRAVKRPSDDVRGRTRSASVVNFPRSGSSAPHAPAHTQRLAHRPVATGAPAWQTTASISATGASHQPLPGHAGQLP